MSARVTEQLLDAAARMSVSDEVESDDDLVRVWQDELREALEKTEAYRADDGLARTFRADAKHSAVLLEELPARIATRRSEIAYDRWAQVHMAAFPEVPVSSRDRHFASVPKAELEALAPALTREIPKKSALWADWQVWNFKRHRLSRFKALPAEAVSRARGSLQHFERLEVWQAVGVADPWLVGIVKSPAGKERFYLLFDWGLETTLDRELLR